MIPAEFMEQSPLRATDWNFVPSLINNRPAPTVELPTSLNPVNCLAYELHAIRPLEVTKQSPFIKSDWSFVPSLINNRPAPAVELPTSVNPVNCVAPVSVQLIAPLLAIEQFPLI